MKRRSSCTPKVIPTKYKYQKQRKKEKDPNIKEEMR